MHIFKELNKNVDYLGKVGFLRNLVLSLLLRKNIERSLVLYFKCFSQFIKVRKYGDPNFRGDYSLSSNV
jgi:hypothetical protein